MDQMASTTNWSIQESGSSLYWCKDYNAHWLIQTAGEKIELPQQNLGVRQTASNAVSHPILCLCRSFFFFKRCRKHNVENKRWI